MCVLVCMHMYVCAYVCVCACTCMCIRVGEWVGGCILVFVGLARTV